MPTLTWHCTVTKLSNVGKMTPPLGGTDFGQNDLLLWAKWLDALKIVRGKGLGLFLYFQGLTPWYYAWGTCISSFNCNVEVILYFEATEWLHNYPLFCYNFILFYVSQFTKIIYFSSRFMCLLNGFDKCFLHKWGVFLPLLDNCFCYNSLGSIPFPPPPLKTKNLQHWFQVKKKTQFEKALYPHTSV